MSMNRTLGEIERGKSVWISEDGNFEEYILLDKTDTAVVLLRKVLLPARRMHSSNVAIYDGCEMDVWLENEASGFLARFDADTLAALVSSEISTYEYGGALTSIARRAFLLSEDNMYGNNATENDPSYVAALMISTDKADPNAARIARDSYGTAQNWW